MDGSQLQSWGILLSAPRQPGQGTPSFGPVGQALIERDYGAGASSRVEVFLEFDNREAAGLGIPLPAGRLRVSQLDEADDTLEFIGEDVIDHTPRDETVRINLGSAFDVVGERQQVDFQVDTRARRMEETIEIRVRNHKDEAVNVEVLEHAGGDWELVRQSQPSEKVDAETFRFRVPVPARGAARVDYRVRVRWC